MKTKSIKAQVLETVKAEDWTDVSELSLRILEPPKVVKQALHELQSDGFVESDGALYTTTSKGAKALRGRHFDAKTDPETIPSYEELHADLSDMIDQL